MQMQKYFAPGRINLIGEHLDYNGGMVLPAAIARGVELTLLPRDNGKILLRSQSHLYALEIDVNDDIFFHSSNDWCNYPLGIIAQLKKEGYKVPACELSYSSNLPEGSGLSSSAAVEIVTAFALLSQVSTQIDLVWLANFCKQVENEFIGVQCGIMDQYAVALGRQEHALLIDCAAIKHSYVPFETGDYTLVVMNTQKPRSLVHSKYNERKAECDEALRIIQATSTEVKHLCDAKPHAIQTITDEIIYKRARHVVTENLRVKESVKALSVNDFSTFGRLMNVSHTSLEQDYEVSGMELDTLVHTAQKVKGCLGARMTGAGFGGCAITLVHRTKLDELVNTVGEHYKQQTGLSASFYETNIGNGVVMLR